MFGSEAYDSRVESGRQEAPPARARNIPSNQPPESETPHVPSVRLRHLQKTFANGVRAVDELSLDVADGELLAVVGPSGCGKTTMLRLIAGLETPTAGAIEIGDRDVTRLAPAKRNVAMAFQDHALYPHLNVYDNLAFGLRMRGKKRAAYDADIRQMAELLQLGELIDRTAAELSEGQRQRVALGRALVRKPDVFLLDEPLTSLDETLRAQLRDEIRRLHRELGTTMIFVTHDQQEAMMLGDRIAVVEDGRLQQCGTPGEVYERPANRRVAALIGTPAMNFIEGRLKMDGEQVVFDAGDWQLAMAPEQTAALKGDNGLGDAETSGSGRHDSGQQVVLGIRPASLRLEASAGDSSAAATIPAEIVSRQSLGDVQQLELTLPGGQLLMGRVGAGADIPNDSACKIAFAAEGLHVFDAGLEGRNRLLS